MLAAARGARKGRALTSDESWSRFAMTARSFSLNFGVAARD